MRPSACSHGRNRAFSRGGGWHGGCDVKGPRRYTTEMNRSIKGIGGALITLLMVAGFSLAAGSTAQAQYSRDRNRNGVDDRYERNRDWRRERNRNSNIYDRNRNGVDDRYERGNVYDRNRNGVDDR